MKSPLPWDRPLFISPHADDVELGCGGTISRLAREGADVRVLVFCTAADGDPTPLAGTFAEQVASLGRLGVPAAAARMLDMPVRGLPDRAAMIREHLLGHRHEVRPDAVFVPASWDTHQDHQAVRAEALRAFRGVTVLGYHFPWNADAPAVLGLFVGLTPDDVGHKLEALECFASQRRRGACYFDPEAIRGLVLAHGLHARRRLAEGFEATRLVL